MFRGVLIAATAALASAPGSAATYYFSDQPAVCCASYIAYSTFVPSGLNLNPGDVVDITLNFKNGKSIYVPGTNYVGITTLVRGGDTRSTYFTSFTTDLIGLSRTIPFDSAATVTSPFGLYAYALGGYRSLDGQSAHFTGVHQRLTFDSGPSFDVSKINIEINAGLPEPTTWAMMLLGFGAIGTGVRRARSRSTETRLPQTL